MKKKRGCSICHQRKDDVFVTRRGGGQAHDTCERAFEDRRRVSATRTCKQHYFVVGSFMDQCAICGEPY